MDRPTWPAPSPVLTAYAALATSPAGGDGAVAAPAPVKPTALASIFLGGAAAVATVNFTHPIETVKTRMQVSGAGVSTTLKSTISGEGVMALWKGLPAAWGRESVYASIKIGGYGPIRDAIGANKPDAPFALKFAAGAASGSIGSAVGNPFDVLKTLAQANAKESMSTSALARKMMKDQGVAGFYRGVQANMLRACVLNGTKMACYDVSKGKVVAATGWSRKDPRTVFVSSVIAGFIMTCTVAPFDMVRTALMNQPTDQKIYTGFLDAATKIAKKDGPMAFYRGFLPIWGRFAPSATLQLLIFETLLSSAGYKAI